MEKLKTNCLDTSPFPPGSVPDDGTVRRLEGSGRDIVKTEHTYNNGTLTDVVVEYATTTTLYQDIESLRCDGFGDDYIESFADRHDGDEKWYQALAGLRNDSELAKHILARPDLVAGYKVVWAHKYLSSRDAVKRGIIRQDTSVGKRIIETKAKLLSGYPPDDVDYMHSVLCHVSLPRSKQPLDVRRFERTSGSRSIVVHAGETWQNGAWAQQPLPYGTHPRLALAHICSEAIKTGSQTVDVGRSVREFLTKLGIGTNAKEYKAFLQRMNALAASRISLGIGDTLNVDEKTFKKFNTWLDTTGEQGALWSGSITLGDDFYNSLKDHAVPINPEAVRAIKNSSLQLDLYFWLTHRLCHITNKPARITWASLHKQFGQEYKSLRSFKDTIVPSLRKVLEVYPEARVEQTVGGVILCNSPPPIPFLS